MISSRSEKHSEGVKWRRFCYLYLEAMGLLNEVWLICMYRQSRIRPQENTKGRKWCHRSVGRLIDWPSFYISGLPEAFAFSYHPRSYTAFLLAYWLDGCLPFKVIIRNTDPLNYRTTKTVSSLWVHIVHLADTRVFDFHYMCCRGVHLSKKVVGQSESKGGICSRL